MQKGFSTILLLIIVVFALLAGATYWFTHTPTSEISQTVIPKKATVSSIVYNKNNSIWVANDDGTNQVDTNISGSEPTLSPDRKWVAYIKDNDIYKFNVETRQEKKLTNQGLKETEDLVGTKPTYLKWSSEGNYVSFVFIIDRCIGICDTPKKNPESIKEGLWIVDSEGRNSTFLVNFPEEQVGQLSNYYTAWLPEGDAIIYREYSKDFENPLGNLKMISLANKKIQDYELQGVGGLDWNLDGKKMIYATLSRWDRNSQGLATSMIIDKIHFREGNNSKVIFENPNHDSIFYSDNNISEQNLSPDGTKVFFIDSSNFLGDPFSYRIIDLSANKEHKFGETLNNLPFKFGQFKNWTDDSQRLVFYIPEQNTAGKFWSIKYDGSDPKIIIDLN